ncbi:hypothetical protein A1O3_03107 [Capronia epimyces CBS 606.96]|uniref:Uncharacterized protein n=1 Tax=Capronia epimyces CBS 606.96 TaxID=1182542 RepID=W9Z6C0_9EURO|nr:uncharacterized protein A1O3_03107 [Capronia epimyces CBS 606.96]EXJ90039.1 hypothetical protein A1O3_03107 [Capronia epimyces CBS 606.96]
MLNLAFRVLAIAACLCGIAECAHISKEILRDHVDNPTSSEYQSAATTWGRELRPSLKPDPSEETSPRTDHRLVTVLTRLVRAFVQIVESTMKRPFPRSAAAHRLQKYAHWTASRTQIHPAIA